MLERHGDFSIMARGASGSPGQYAVTHVVTGQMRHFETLEACREYLGVARGHGPHWDVVPLDAAGKPLHEPAVIAAADEAAAKAGGRDWFHFIGVFHIKDLQVKPHKILHH